MNIEFTALTEFKIAKLTFDFTFVWGMKNCASVNIAFDKKCFVQTNLNVCTFDDLADVQLA